MTIVYLGGWLAVKNGIKWILLLPVSLAIMVAVRTLYRLIINVFLGPSSGVMAMLDELFVTAAATGAYLYAGTHIAPAHKYATSIVLSLIYSVFAIVAFVLLISQYGDFFPRGETEYSIWGTAVAVLTCIAYCVAMAKRRIKM
jgi:hypothetical protein